MPYPACLKCSSKVSDCFTLNSSIAINEKQSIIPHDLSGRLLKSEKAFLNLSAESGTIVVKGSFKLCCKKRPMKLFCSIYSNFMQFIFFINQRYKITCIEKYNAHLFGKP